MICLIKNTELLFPFYGFQLNFIVKDLKKISLVIYNRIFAPGQFVLLDQSIVTQNFKENVYLKSRYSKFGSNL